MKVEIWARGYGPLQCAGVWERSALQFFCLLSMFLFDSCESKLGAVDGYPYPRHEQGAIMCTLAKLIMINTP